MFHQRTRDTVVVLHDEPKDPVHMIKIVKGGLRIATVSIPDDREPLAGLDQVGADQQTGDEAIKLLDQHCLLAKGEQFLLKLLEMAR